MGGLSPEASGRVRARQQVGVPAARPAGSRRRHTLRARKPLQSPRTASAADFLSESVWLMAWTASPTSLRFLLSHQHSALCHLSAGPPTGSGVGVSPQGHLSTLHLQFLSKYVITVFRVFTFDQGSVFSLGKTSESKGWESCLPLPGRQHRAWHHLVFSKC